MALSWILFVRKLITVKGNHRNQRDDGQTTNKPPEDFFFPQFSSVYLNYKSHVIYWQIVYRHFTFNLKIKFYQIIFPLCDLLN